MTKETAEERIVKLEDMCQRHEKIIAKMKEVIFALSENQTQLGTALYGPAFKEALKKDQVRS